MSYKFERLEVWQLALEYIDLMYEVGGQLPKVEEYNLKSQSIRAATSVALNVAEGSTGQSDAEQGRFLGLAIRSLIETFACLRLIQRRRYAVEPELMDRALVRGEHLFSKLQAFRRHLTEDPR